jgi:Glyoxalase-like domain
VRIDHVIYATRDLDAAAARLETALGVAAVAGGRHRGLGTHNRIVPLGGSYIEVLAVCDPEEAASSTLGAALQAHIEQEGDGLMGWAVAVDDVRPVAA